MAVLILLVIILATLRLMITLLDIDALVVNRGHQTNNTAHNDGGCFFLSNITKVELNESTFGSCSARSGRGKRT